MRFQVGPDHDFSFVGDCLKSLDVQELMPDSLHWLGITKIDNLISMSDMKYNAIVGSGIQVCWTLSQSFGCVVRN